MMQLRTIAIGMLVGGICLAACGSEQDRDGVRPDPEVLGGKADLEPWMVLKQQSLDCGSTIAGAMAGFDSAHAYGFDALAGTLYTFDFDARFGPERGAVVAVYGPQGTLIQRERKTFSQQASVSFAAQSSGRHHVAVYSVRWWATGAYTLQTTCGIAGLNQRAPGDSSFSTFEQELYRRWALEGAAKGAPDGRAGEVEEGDIYRLDGNRLYYFNTYRGLMIFDISDPKSPQLQARVPVFGYPVEMYVEGSKVYALIRDALYLTRGSEGRLRLDRRNVSQLVTIDVPANLAASKPKVLQTHDIVGQLREGVSRKIANTIYVVSYQPRWYYWGWRQPGGEEPTEQAWVHAFDVTDPNAVKKVDELKIFEGGSINVTGADGTTVHENFNDVAISATSNALMVVENWSSYSRQVPGGDFSCSQSQWLNKARVSIVDISDPSGKIALHAKFETYGELRDQFKQTYMVSGGKGVYLGIFARREWTYADCTGTSHIENTLESWDVSSGKPVRLDALSFGKPDETVRGSVFDRDRQVAFAITARNIDPLYAISFADPAALKVLSEIDGLSGDMNVFRPIADGKFLIGVGQDDSDACTGFDGPATGWATKVAVSIIDVQDPDQIRLVQRQCVAVKDAEWFGSEVNWNLDQAHKMIGMHSDGLVNVVTVPVYYARKIDDPARSWWWYRHETAVGVMSWDLTRYDPALPETQQDVLRNHGAVVHPDGQVRRSIVFTHQGPGGKIATSRRKMINLSDTHMSLTDLQDLASPQPDAVVELAPYVASIQRIAGGAYVVEQVKSSPWSWDEGDASEFRVRATSGLLENNPVVASFTVSQVEQALPFGDDVLVLIRRVRDAAATAGSQPIWYQPWKKQAVVYDLSNPAKPTFAGAVELPMSYVAYHRYRCGTSPFWFGHADGNGWSPTTAGLVFLSSEYDHETLASDRRLVLLDLRNRYSPQVLEQPLPADADLTFVGIAADRTSWAGDSVLVSYRQRVGDKQFDGQTFAEQRYFVQRWRVTGGLFAADAPVNVPGRLVESASIQGRPLLLTQDSAYEKTTSSDGSSTSFQPHPRLNLLWLAQGGPSPLALLSDSQTFTGMYLKDLVLHGRELYVNARASYPYFWGPVPFGSAQPKEVTGDQLLVLRLSADSISKLYGEDTRASNLEIMGARGSSLFLGLSGDGVLVVDVKTPWAPAARQFVRTLGYATHVEFAGTSAFVASGYYGVYQIDLQSKSQLPVAN